MGSRAAQITETIPLPPGGREAGAALRQAHQWPTLLVYHRDGTELVELRPGARQVIGRTSPSDVQIDDDSLSRQHACFTLLENGSVRVEDLGSLNGTWVQGERVTEGVARIGDEVMLGRVIITIGERAPEASFLPGLLSYERLRSMLEDEVVRARFFGRSAAILMVRAGGRESAHVSRWLARVQAELRPIDKVGLYSLDAVAVLLPEATLGVACDIAHRISEPKEGGATLLVGVAASPETARSAEKLLEGCRAALQRAAPGRHVHSMPGGPWTWGSPSGQPETDEQPVVESAAMRQVFMTVARLARSSIPVLLQGETGTGKEVIARALHEQSPRHSRPMVCVNCGAIPQQLVESTLFGYERGAFTGAAQQQKGIFEAAEGGTVFLDEVGELPLAAQAALLRVLETRRVARVGSTKEIDVDVRLIAATHRDLEAMATSGSFRLDLLFRLNTMTLDIPPLRERVEEIEPLAMRFLMLANQANERRIQRIQPDALALLRSYPWSGNVRELRNAIERAVVIAEGDSISVHDLPERVRAAGRIGNLAAKEVLVAAAEPAPANDAGGLRTRMQNYEAQVIVEALRASSWNQTEAARKLEMPLRTLVHRMKVLGIKKLGFGTAEPSQPNTSDESESDDELPA
ncbi:sigma 54-interacting transcriptional regulator [Polyangium sp. 6x1]|uniref:sigma 54-interacting transcriptional regulator n=1 Tax=Polyangium sp. 6x1 TaxID=3042689 RepID=UPI0024829CE8|nr:sigma 54-interacting transcriptional regulator [Polyangium sp. 6x1]MDI1446329.1 sigma 54-interacting transcriptional regulator [Polyangium sp. 6x1]